MKILALFIILSTTILPLKGQEFEYFYHPNLYDVEMVCSNNNEYKMLVNDKFNSYILNIANNEIEDSIYGTTFQLISYDDSYCDYGTIGLTDYDITIPSLLNIDDRENLNLEVYDIGQINPIFENLYGNSIKVEEQTFLISFHGGTYLITTTGETLASFPDLKKGAFMRSPLGIFMLTNDGEIFRFDANAKTLVLHDSIDQEFKNIWAIMYSNSQDKFYVFDGNLWELDLNGSASIFPLNIGDIRSFTVFEDKIYYTPYNLTNLIFEFDLEAETNGLYFQNDDPNFFFRHLSHNEDGLIAASHYRLNNKQTIALLQHIPDNMNYGPKRVDFSVSNFSIEKKVNYLFGSPSNPDILNYANVDLTFNFEIENNGVDTLTNFTSYDDATTFFGQEKQHNHQVSIVIPPGENRSISYTRTLGLPMLDNKTINVFIPGADYKLDLDLSDNTVTTDISLDNQDISFDGCKIFPNPAHNKLFVSMPNYTALKFQIMNNLGVMVQQFDISPLSNGIDISNLSNGVYFLNIQSNDGLSSKVIKFVKM